MDSESDASMFDLDELVDDKLQSSDDEEENFDPVPKAAAAKAKGVRGGGKGKAAASSGAAGKKALAPKENVINADSGSKTKNSKKSDKTVEQIYQKKTQLEHILLRPDTYIGSVERDTQTMYVYRDGRIVEREITFTPGLYKIFDEILVNAADNKQRDPNMSALDVEVDAAQNLISVRNNGKGIPIVVHKEHKVYVPTMIFGHLLTGSNFDDGEKKTTGGRNGYGAKLANVFSKMFKVECLDSEHGLKFSQVFRDNMGVHEEPIVKKATAVELKHGDYVKISFSPDLERFGMTELDEDAVSLFKKRAYDIAGTMASRGGAKMEVKLNGEKLPIKSFKDYLGLFEGINAPVAYEKNDRWEVGVSASKDASLHQISFVNAICTSKGGGHVTYIADQVAAHLVKVLKRIMKKKIGELKPTQIKNHLTIFVNCLVENPTFDSQTKEFLTSKPKSFGSLCDLSEKFLKQIEKSDVVTTIESYLSFRDREALKRKGGSKKTKITGITKLDDANFAGTAKSQDCTLIITEGDSAKTLAVSGISVVGRDFYGVFPLRGKLMNVRDETDKKIAQNEEIKNLVEILGLKYQTVYSQENIKSLRYGHLMIMTDQDTDGSHIKGLVINFIHKFWPSLLDVPGFLQQFITPIVKVSKGKKVKTFFTLQEYEKWSEETGNEGKGWTVKYYKGLGTSTSQEAKEYFSHLKLHEITFKTLETDKEIECEDFVDDKGRPVASTGSDLIDMVFRKGRCEDRKLWLNKVSRNKFMDYLSASNRGGVLYSEFINNEYIHFSGYDLERSIPNIMDGFKPSQRKVLYACLKRNLKGEIKVAQLTGYVAEHSAYHHGEMSLQMTIVGMAQNFCGSNNVNLLTPSGQFGTRRMGGKDAASARYIFTKLEPITRAVFHPDDDDLLTYLKDDGNTIEPEYYIPVIPMVLVNGAEGIGTGWSTNISNYNPREIIANLRRKISGEEVIPMKPFYSGFVGDILEVEGRAGSYRAYGRMERLDESTLLISELPLRKWTQDYKGFLDGLLTGQGKNPPEIKDFKENHTERSVSFTIVTDKEKIEEWEASKEGLYGKFKMSTHLNATNMHLFDPDGRIMKYETPEEIMDAFYEVRKDYYEKRKEMLLYKLRREQRILSNKARFVEEVCSGDLIVSNRKRAELLAELKDRGYELFTKDDKKEEVESDSEEEEDAQASTDAELAKGYEYLMGMKIWTLTYEKAKALRDEFESKTAQLEELEATPPTELWLRDLDAIEVALDERDAQMAKDLTDEMRAQQKSQKHSKKVAKKLAKGRKGKKKKNEWESEDEVSDESDNDSVMSEDSVPKKVASKQAFFPRLQGVLIKPKIEKPEVKVKKVKKDDIGQELSQAMEQKLEVSPAKKPKAKGRTAVKKQANTKKRPSPKIDKAIESDSDDDALNLESAVALKPAPGMKKEASKASQPVKRNKPAARGKKATSQRKKYDSDSEEDFDVVSAEPLEIEPKTNRNRRAVAQKQIVYNIDDSESEEDDESE